MSEQPTGLKCRFESTGLDFEQGTEFSDWQNVVGFLKSTGKATPIWIGDALNFGQDKFGELYSQVLETTGYDPDTISHYQSVMRRVPRENRFSGLSYSHYRLVSKMSHELQREALKQANDQRLSVRQLKSIVDAGGADKDPMLLCPFCRLPEQKSKMVNVKACKPCADKAKAESLDPN